MEMLDITFKCSSTIKTSYSVSFAIALTKAETVFEINVKYRIELKKAFVSLNYCKIFQK